MICSSFFLLIRLSIHFTQQYTSNIITKKITMAYILSSSTWTSIYHAYEYYIQQFIYDNCKYSSCSTNIHVFNFTWWFSSHTYMIFFFFSFHFSFDSFQRKKICKYIFIISIYICDSTTNLDINMKMSYKILVHIILLKIQLNLSPHIFNKRRKKRSKMHKLYNCSMSMSAIYEEEKRHEP